MTDATTTPRPMLNVSEAADATGKSRRTIGRLLDAGALNGVERDDAGTWRIPVDALLTAGLTLHAPSPPDEPPAELVARQERPEPNQLDEVRAELADWRTRALVAEATAAERADALDDVRTALDLANRMLTAGPSTSTDPAAAEPARRPRLLGRWRKQP
jgi:hypothetical protein